MQIEAEAKARNHPEVHCCACGKLALQSALLVETASVGDWVLVKEFSLSYHDRVR